MFDFPTAPALDQEYTVGDITYVFNGQGWTLKASGGGGGGAVDAYTKAESDAKFVDVTGDTLSGGLTVAAPLKHLTMDSPQVSQIIAKKNGALRWTFLMAGEEPETGSDTGSDFSLARYGDTGAYLPAALKINRATGVTDFPATPTVNGVPIGGGGGAVDAYTKAESDTKFVDVAGDTMTGKLSITDPGRAEIFLSGMNGVLITTAQVPTAPEWRINANSNELKIEWFAGGTTPQGAALTIERNRGEVSVIDDPIGPLTVTPKRYVDQQDAGGALVAKTYTDNQVVGCVLKVGDTMIGPLMLPAAPPVMPEEAVNKAYCDIVLASAMTEIDKLRTRITELEAKAR